MPVAKKKPPAPAPAAPPPKADPARPVVHPEVRAELHLASAGNAWTAADAKAQLGWEETTDAEAALGVDRTGKKFVTTRNAHNREFVPAHAETLMQTILMRQWEFNAQPIIVDEHDELQTGQHRDVALVWAQQELDAGPNAAHWRERWPDGVVSIDTLVVYGTRASATVVNTQDTGRPQTYADTLYRGPHFADLGPKKRARFAKAAENAVNLLWSRVGGNADAFAPKKTHAGMDDFLLRHPGVAKAVRHVCEEDESRGVSQYLTAGYASACMYMMAASFSDGEAYHAATPPAEGLLDLGHVVGDLPSGQSRTALQAAEEFWSLLAGEGKEFKGVRDALKHYVPDPNGPDGPEDYGIGSEGVSPSLDERLSVVVKAWGAFVGKGSLSRKALRLEYTRNDDGVRVLNADQRLRFDGIDRGDPKQREDEDRDETEEQTGFTDAEPAAEVKESVKQAAARIKAEREAKIKGAADGQPLDPLPSSKPKSKAPPPAPPAASTANGRPVKPDAKSGPKRGGTGK